MSAEAWGLIVGAFAFIGTLIGIVTAISRVSDRLTKAESAHEEAKEAKALAVSAKGELADFREKVAREYATSVMVAAVEARVVAAIDRLGDRLDRILEARDR